LQSVTSSTLYGRNVSVLYKDSGRTAQETLRFGYKNQSINDVQGGAEPTDTFQMVIDNVWKH